MNRPLLTRRLFVSAVPSIALAPFARAADAPLPSGDPRLGPRVIGDPKAPVLVQEWFSFTCTHCAHFATEEFPQVREKLIDTGKIRYQFHDFCWDKVALTAAMVARSLPEDRYVPFLEALFSSQQQWAFAQEGDPLAKLRQVSALAGIPEARFKAIADDGAFARALYDQIQKDGETYGFNGTPYFRFNDKPFTQDPETYEKFADLVAKA